MGRHVLSSGADCPPSVTRGNLVSYQAEGGFNGDNTINVRISVSTYNSRGQLLTATTDVDSDGDGTIDQTSVVTTVYDGVKR